MATYEITINARIRETEKRKTVFIGEEYLPASFSSKAGIFLRPFIQSVSRLTNLFSARIISVFHRECYGPKFRRVFVYLMILPTPFLILSLVCGYPFSMFLIQKPVVAVKNIDAMADWHFNMRRPANQ